MRYLKGEEKLRHATLKDFGRSNVAYDEDYQAALPRSRKMDGTDLHIVEGNALGDVTISDGARTAVYRPLEGKPLGPEKLRIFPAYVEAGAFVEANCVTLTNQQERKVVYVPVGQPG